MTSPPQRRRTVPQRSRRQITAAVTAAVAVLLGGCTSSAIAGHHVSTPTPGSPESTGRDHPADVLQLTSQTSVPLPGEPSVLGLELFGSHLVWGACVGCSERFGNPNIVFVRDLTSGHTRQVAKSAWTSGLIGSVSGTGNTVVWTDLSRLPSEGDPNAEWAMWAENLRTGHRWTITSSHGRSDGDWPAAIAAEGRIVWRTLDVDGRTSDIMVTDLATRHTSILVRHVLPFNASLSAGWVVYDDAFPPHQPGETWNRPPSNSREIYAVPVTGGTPRDLGGNHQASAPWAQGGWATWGQPVNGDQNQIWAVNLRSPDASPRRVCWCSNNVREPGRSFVAFDGGTGGGVQVVSDTGGAAPATRLAGLAWYVPGGFSTEGPLVAFATQVHPLRNGLITLHIDTVVPAG
ncbi:MAG: hypothetical protein ACRDP1_14070 [Nocardioidaceae bacterium]